ncbi:hypothetical protein DBV15_07368, partial [Temnothorax longispinosus]
MLRDTSDDTLAPVVASVATFCICLLDACAIEPSLCSRKGSHVSEETCSPFSGSMLHNNELSNSNRDSKVYGDLGRPLLFQDISRFSLSVERRENRNIDPSSVSCLVVQWCAFKT